MRLFLNSSPPSVRFPKSSDIPSTVLLTLAKASSKLIPVLIILFSSASRGRLTPAVRIVPNVVNFCPNPTTTADKEVDAEVSLLEKVEACPICSEYLLTLPEAFLAAVPDVVIERFILVMDRSMFLAFRSYSRTPNRTIFSPVS
jgi:hypothetical protein